MRIILFLFLSMVSLIACKGSAKKISLKGGELEILEKGKGEALKPGDYALIYYSMVDESGKVIQSSREQSNEPLPVAIPKVIDTLKKGSPIEEGISKLSVGDSCKITVNLTEEEKAIQKQQNPNYKGENSFFFLIRVDSKKTEQEFQQYVAERKNKQMEEGKKVTAEIDTKIADVKTGKYGKPIITPGGVQVYVVEEGKGAKAEKGKMVQVNYYGCLSSNGKAFDSSFFRGQPVNFPLVDGGLIQGWLEGIPTMKEGGKVVMLIPSKMGYGESGMGQEIPPNSDLTFYVELLKVEEFKQ